MFELAPSKWKLKSLDTFREVPFAKSGSWTTLWQSAQDDLKGGNSPSDLGAETQEVTMLGAPAHDYTCQAVIGTNRKWIVVNNCNEPELSDWNASSPSDLWLAQATTLLATWNNPRITRLQSVAIQANQIPTLKLMKKLHDDTPGEVLDKPFWAWFNACDDIIYQLINTYEGLAVTTFYQRARFKHGLSEIGVYYTSEVSFLLFRFAEIESDA